MNSNDLGYESIESQTVIQKRMNHQNEKTGLTFQAANDFFLIDIDIEALAALLFPQIMKQVHL